MRGKKIAVLVLLITGLAAMPGYQQVVRMTGDMGTPMTLVIDAGHGGMDGGASAPDGTLERDVNLRIAKALQAEAELYDVRVILTRETEAGILPPGNVSGRWSKVEDMRERKRLITEADADLVISIHLNSFVSDSDVKGIQVFYPRSSDQEVMEETKTLAEALQNGLNGSLSGDDDRVATAKNDIYLFRNALRPMVLIECGFMSNPEDMEKLTSPKYQGELAARIMEIVGEKYQLSRPQVPKTDVIDSRTNN